MAEGRDRKAWDCFARLMAKIHNLVITKDSDAKAWVDFHPYFNGEYGYENITDDFWENFDPDNPTMRDGGLDADTMMCLFGGKDQ